MGGSGLPDDPGAWLYRVGYTNVVGGCTLTSVDALCEAYAEQIAPTEGPGAT